MLRRVNGGKGKKGGSGNGGGNGNEGNNKINYKRSPDKGKSPGELLDNTAESNGGDRPNTPPRLNGGEETPQQAMLDAYDEGYGTDSWDPQERDSMAREINANNSGQQYSADEYAQILRDSGYEEDEIQNMINEDPRYATNNTQTTKNRTQEYTSTPQVVQQSTRTTPKRNLKGTLRGIGAVAGAGIKYVAPKAARLALKGTVAGAAAMGGIAAGLVSEDYGNVVKWGAAGAGAGWIAGGGIASTTEKLSEVDDKLSSAAEKGDSIYTLEAHGPEAEKERQKQMADARAMKDKERRKLYENKLKLSAAQAKEAMQDAQKFRESGITDDELIIKAMKSQQFGTERVSKEKIILAGLAEEVGKEEKKLKYVQGQLKGKGISQEDIDKYTAGIKELNEWTI